MGRDTGEADAEGDKDEDRSSNVDGDRKGNRDKDSKGEGRACGRERTKRVAVDLDGMEIWRRETVEERERGGRDGHGWGRGSSTCKAEE